MKANKVNNDDHLLMGSSGELCPKYHYKTLNFEPFGLLI